jgi:hypothetical protein
MWCQNEPFSSMKINNQEVTKTTQERTGFSTCRLSAPQISKMTSPFKPLQDSNQSCSTPVRYAANPYASTSCDAESHRPVPAWRQFQCPTPVPMLMHSALPAAVPVQFNAPGYYYPQVAAPVVRQSWPESLPQLSAVQPFTSYSAGDATISASQQARSKKTSRAMSPPQRRGQGRWATSGPTPFRSSEACSRYHINLTILTTVPYHTV